MNRIKAHPIRHQSTDPCNPIRAQLLPDWRLLFSTNMSLFTEAALAAAARTSGGICSRVRAVRTARAAAASIFQLQNKECNLLTRWCPPPARTHTHTPFLEACLGETEFHLLMAKTAADSAVRADTGKRSRPRALGSDSPAFACMVPGDTETRSRPVLHVLLIISSRPWRGGSSYAF